MQSRSTLRFLSASTLDRFLAEAGFTVEDRFGDWDGSVLGPSSPEIITIVKKNSGCVS